MNTKYLILNFSLLHCCSCPPYNFLYCSLYESIINSIINHHSFTISEKKTHLENWFNSLHVIYLISKTDICICSLWVVWMLGAVKITLMSVSIPGKPYLCISVILLICLKLHNLKTVLIYFLWFSLSWRFITNYQI